MPPFAHPSGLLTSTVAHPASVALDGRGSAQVVLTLAPLLGPQRTVEHLLNTALQLLRDENPMVPRDSQQPRDPADLQLQAANVERGSEKHHQQAP